MVLEQESLFTREKLNNFIAYMRRLGYRMSTPVEWEKVVERLNPESPRKKIGKQIKFTFEANGLVVDLNTTIDPITLKLLPEHYGWGMIKKGDNKLYYGHPFLRTEGFLRRIYMFAKITRYRVLHIPLCPICHKEMEIARGKGLKSRYWTCRNPSHKKKNAGWDIGLRPWMHQYLEEIRRERAKAKKKYVSELADPTKYKPAILRRRPWKYRNRKNVRL